MCLNRGRGSDHILVRRLVACPILSTAVNNYSIPPHSGTCPPFHHLLPSSTHPPPPALLYCTLQRTSIMSRIGAPAVTTPKAVGGAAPTMPVNVNSQVKRANNSSSVMVRVSPVGTIQHTHHVCTCKYSVYYYTFLRYKKYKNPCLLATYKFGSMPL